MFHGRNTNSEYIFQPLNISSNIFERNNIPSISRISVASISISRSTSHNNPSLHNIVMIRTARLTDRDRRREDAITRAKRWKKENEEGPLPPLDRLYRNRIVSTGWRARNARARRQVFFPFPRHEVVTSSSNEDSRLTL